MTTYANFERLLENKGLSAYEIGKKLDIPQSTFSMWKSGKTEPKINKLEKIAKFFDIPTSYFYTGELIEKPKNDFSNDDLLMARELNKSDKVELIKSIMKIQNEKDIQLIDMLTKKILETQK